MHKNLEDFEFQPDPTTDYRVTCPLASEESMYNVVNTLAPSFLMNNVVNTLAPSFLIGSSSFVQVTRTCVRTWRTLNFDQIRPLTLELPAL